MNATTCDCMRLYAVSFFSQAKYVRSAAHAAGGASAFTILAPGQSVRVAHAGESCSAPLHHLLQVPPWLSTSHHIMVTVSEMYDFSASGPGQYTVALKLNVFYHFSGGKLFALNTEVGKSYHTVNISGNAMARIRPTSEPEIDDCEGWQSHAIEGAIPLAQKYVANALAYVRF